MRKLFSLAVSLLFVLPLSLSAQMTDVQVVEYVKTAMSSGKSQTQIYRELLAKGVTREQAQRIKDQYDNGSLSSSSSSSSADGDDRNQRRRTVGVKGAKVETETATEVTNIDDLPDDAMAETVPPTTQPASMRGNASRIFGHDVFASKSLTFEPNENAATPENYKLGPGDEVVIDIWGYNEDSITRTISPEGKIFISQIGPVQLSGLTIKAASERIRSKLAAKYAGLEDAQSSVSVTLGQIRTIQVNVMGEAKTPGTYRLSSFSTVFTAVYRAGGINDIGSLRAIKVIRGGKEVATVDLYGYLFEGKSESDITLQEGDIIIIPPYLNLVSVEGSLKRPMQYELKDGETLATLISYAGGFASNAYTDNVQVIRRNETEKEVFTVKSSMYDSYEMHDGDSVTVRSGLDRYSNMVIVTGYVFQPGMYELGDEIATVRQLITHAGGLREDAFLPRAVLTREKEDLTYETLALDLNSVMNGGGDVLLRKNDVLKISGIHEIEDRGTLTINGAVVSPGSFDFAENTTVEDLIIKAGGLIEGASVARVDVSRLAYDKNAVMPSDTLGYTYTFPIGENLALDESGAGFILQPYDVVSVRMSPGYRTQSYVTVSGAVAFPGNYQLVNKSERVSDLIERTGGLTPQAYAAGARLYRNNNNKNNRSDIAMVLEGNTRKVIDEDGEEKEVAQIDVADTYLVSIDLEKAMKNPGSDYDIILRSGDRLSIPEIENTVRIVGEVMFPNAVSYIKGRGLDYYINAAGGFSVNAKKNKAYVVYLNGSASKSGGFHTAKISPGCTIVVPSKPEKEKTSIAEVSAVTSASASLASVIAMIANLFL